MPDLQLLRIEGPQEFGVDLQHAGDIGLWNPVAGQASTFWRWPGHGS